ncbi:lysylphosphatidylglycerol synthase transmembrane domain-containing protein [uncultured Rhodoblastus sp.]|uniref:lysylphosphatidylglycerol synthase transmembrane domain-containing protein n=1 Tax=uncultured Rhodoblastus sp. TaxID=543037 RepID=UPI0025D83B01|nr:lysylphosphatidylglycerol synthase transmembrane domain-containing protein [uncultured Rhodoblastus sp.]
MIAKTAVSALLVTFLVSRVDLSAVRESLAAASWAKLALALIIFFIVPLLGGLRWWLAFRGIGVSARLPELTVLFSAALVFGQALPSVAGDGARVVLASRHGYNLRASLQSVMAERVFMVLGVLALALATSPLLAELTGDRRPIWIAGAALAAGLAGLALLLVADRMPIPSRLRLGHALTYAAEPARRLATSRWGGLLAFASIVSNLNFTLAAISLGDALDVKASAWDMLAIMPAVTMVTILPISLGGWGVREGALVFLLGRAGVPAVQALSLSLLFGLFGMVSGLPGLLVWAIGWRGREGTTPGVVTLTVDR